MLRVKNLGANKTEIQTDNGEVFFSYAEPVAAHWKGQWIRTSKRWSVTTSRHVTQWLDGIAAVEVPQETLDGLLS